MRTERHIFLLHGDRELRERFARLLGRAGRLEVVESWEELRARIPQAPPTAVALVDPAHGDGRGGHPSPELHQLLGDFPALGVIAAVELGNDSRSAELLLTLGRYGVAEVVEVHSETSLPVLRHKLDRVRGRVVYNLLEAKLHFTLAAKAFKILALAVDVAEARGGYPKDLSRRFEVSPRTLNRMCKEAGLPSPRDLMMWIRTLFASRMLDSSSHDLVTVARASGYSSAWALRRALIQTVGLVPKRLRMAGAYQTAAGEFVRVLAAERERARKELQGKRARWNRRSAGTSSGGGRKVSRAA